MTLKPPSAFNAMVALIVLGAVTGFVWLLSSSYGHKMEAEPDDFVVAIFTTVLGVFAVVQSMFLFRQDKVLRQSIEDAKDANKNAKASAEAAMEANGIATRHAKQQLRAYLSIEKSEARSICKILNVQSPGRALYFLNYVVNITNRGQTPANNVKIKVACAKEFRENFDVKSFVEDILSNRERIFDFYEYVGVIHASANHIQIIAPIQNMDVGGDYKKNVLSILMIEYKDAFGESHLESRTSYFESVNSDSKEHLYPEGCIST